MEVRQSSRGDALAFEVSVHEGAGSTAHKVTLNNSDFERLCRRDEDPEQFVRRCFEFLLAREPKESIMGSFDVSVISRYFPEFEAEISR